MERLELALMPTDEKTAKSVNWTHFPSPTLNEALKNRTHNNLWRSDDTLDEKQSWRTKNLKITGDNLCFDIIYM